MPQSQARLAPAQYTFAPANKQITFAGVPGFALDGLIEVYHVASGNTLYDAYDPTLGGVISGTTLTLAFDTTATYTAANGNATSYAASDVLRVIYNDLSRDDQILTFNPTGTGYLPVIPLRSAQALTLNIVSTTAITCQVEMSVDGTNWTTGTLGRLPNLYSNSGDANATQGAPYNTRVYDVSAFRFIRINVVSMAAGSPTVNVCLKTNPATTRDVFVTAGIVQASFDSGAGVGYIRQQQQYTETLRGSLAANATLTGTSRQANGWPNPYMNRFEASVISDQNGTLTFQFSDDNSNWVTMKTVQVTGGTLLQDFVRIMGQFHRVLYANGASPTGTTAFTLKTAYSTAG